jgi:raffinose/stachyose/melibiose transport system permease protein
MKSLTESTRRLLLLGPALLLLGIFVFYPAFSALRLAFFDADGLSPARFNGLRNFLTLGSDELVRTAAVNLALFAALSVPLQTCGPLLAAKFIYGLRSARFAYVYRSLLVLPMVVPSITLVLIWREIYGMNGPLNQALAALGLGMLEHSWLGEPATALPAIVATGFPWMGGASLLIYLGGFLAIPTSLHEAAVLDGARPWDVFWRIELPHLRPQIALITTVSILGALQSFENILLLTNGGPFNASLTPALYLFRQGFEFGNLGYASALGVALLVLCVGLSLAVRRLNRRASA